jgi:hypothetical protein
MKTISEIREIIERCRHEGGHVRCDTSGDFVKLYVDRLTHVHFFLRHPVDRVPPHTHLYPFTSTLLCGELLNVIYREVPSPHGMFDKYRPGSDGKLESTGERANLAVERVDALHGGITYSMSSEVIHEPFIVMPTITFVERQLPPIEPTVYLEHGDEPDNHQYLITPESEAESWAVIDGMLPLIEARTKNA